jgi:tetratricopeptide (TPR) repeat protein
VAAGELSAEVVAQLQRLQSTLSEHVTARIAQGREQLRVGEYDRVEAILAEVRVAGTWTQLTAAAQANVLRLAGGLAVRRRDLAAARDLAVAADAVCPSEPRLAASIAATEAGPDAALEVLGEPASREGRQFRAAMLLERGDVAAAVVEIEALIAEDLDDIESLRLLALTRLMQGRRPEALEAVAGAEAKAPAWLSVIYAGSVVRYATTLSPVTDFAMVVYPNPVARYLVKTDDVSTSMLETALAGLEKLLAKPFADDIVQIWKLACLANLPGREAEAQHYCRELLDACPVRVAAIAWALERGYAFDRSASLTDLADRYARGAADENQIRAYAWLLIDEGGPEAAAAALEQGLDAQQGDSRTEADEWIGRLRGEAMPTPDGEELWTSSGALSRSLSCRSLDLI